MIQQIHKSESGELKIGYISPVYQQHLADMLLAMHGVFPHVKINLFEMLTLPQIKAMEDGSLDVGILRAPVHSTQYRQNHTIRYTCFIFNGFWSTAVYLARMLAYEEKPGRIKGPLPSY